MPVQRRKIPPTISDAEEARIQAGIANDPDNPELTKEELAKMRPASEVLPPALFAALKRQPGRPKAAVTKQEVKLRLDPHIVAAFKATGTGWQTRMNDALAKVARGLVKQQREGGTGLRPRPTDAKAPPKGIVGKRRAG